MAPLPVKPSELDPQSETAPKEPNEATKDPSASKNASRTDMILVINDPYMQQIVDGTKTYEYRKYDMVGIKRIWFYRTAPHSAITHVCEVDAAVTRGPGIAPLPEDGLGNKEFNEWHPDWDLYDFAYRIKSVYSVNAPDGIPWAQMRDLHGMKMPPRGRVSLPQSIGEEFKWNEQTKIR